MAKKEFYDIAFIRSEIEEDAKKTGWTAEEELNFLKKVNQEDSKLPIRIEVVDDWKCIPGGYEKEYRMRRAVQGRNSILTGIPIEFLERQARKHKMSVDQLMKDFRVVASYDDRDYVTYRLRKWFVYKP
jgi:hypothetical protein